MVLLLCWLGYGASDKFLRGRGLRCERLVLTLRATIEVPERLPGKAPGRAIRPAHHYPTLIPHDNPFVYTVLLRDLLFFHAPLLLQREGSALGQGSFPLGKQDLKQRE